MSDLKKIVQAYALKTLGFDDCKFAAPFLNKELDEYRQKIKSKKIGKLTYLERHLKYKENPDLLLEGVKSAIVLIKNYNTFQARYNSNKVKIARFALAHDYHEILTAKLTKLDFFIKKQDEKIKTYFGVDSRPLAERTLALKSGIGFRGKNNLLIKPGLGSYFVIGVMLTTAEFAPDETLNLSCGDCRLCIESCPQKALSENSLDIEQCISYKNTNSKNKLSETEIADLSGWAKGCDICQEVCPYNALPKLTDWPEFYK
jgi:epoxyqueuosine reductase